MDLQSNKATGNAVQRKAGIKAPATTDNVANDVVLPPDVVNLVDQFRVFQRQTAAAYIGLGRTVYTASETLSREKLRQFCDEVGLEFEGPHYKARLKVGENAPRFEAVIDKLPDKPTTIDWMARIPPNQFEQLLQYLNPDSKKRELLAVLPAGSRKKRAKKKTAVAAASHSPRWLIESPGPLDESTMAQVHEELTKVTERFGLSMKPIDPTTA